MTLAEALRRATHDLGYCSHGGDAEHLAAAAFAWMQEPAQIERMARAARPDAWAEDGAIGEIISADAKATYYAGLRKVTIQRARAAIAALSEPPR